ncbi:hypothetical protein ILUMI_21376 [Ignelater luminosus]|uniref:RING-type E3 ubiquitin transferase n=1 Tax=Ignelater luminosus TaxID=2038154 RepID=A0A8K0CCH9_IGNLU|nr:hypothetical protein ILUMI_21376 [Ignelater luminosus]
MSCYLEASEVLKINPNLLEIGDFGTSILKCSSCKTYLKPPVYKCASNHGICEHCTSFEEKCSICNEEILPDRSVSLESLVNRAKYPCWFRHGGCTHVDTLSGLEQHDSQCISNLIKHCVFHLSELECKWTGKASDELRHCMVYHNPNVFLSEKTNFTFKNQKFTFLIFVKDILLFGQIINSNDAQSILCQICYKTPLEGNAIQAELEFVKPFSEDSRRFQFNCNLVQEFKEFDYDDQHLRVSESKVRHLKDGDNYEMVLRIT